MTVIKEFFDQQDKAVSVSPFFHAFHPLFQLHAVVCLANERIYGAKTMAAQKITIRESNAARLRERRFSVNVRYDI